MCVIESVCVYVILCVCVMFVCLCMCVSVFVCVCSQKSLVVSRQLVGCIMSSMKSFGKKCWYYFKIITISFEFLL